ncbi:MAG: hypothetical protein C0490_15950, partial [Marivirga sp.]|nr:hypothetical protein [Marivirga sp.]
MTKGKKTAHEKSKASNEKKRDKKEGVKVAGVDGAVADPNVEYTKVSKIKLSDAGSKRFAVFLNKEKTTYIKRRMDGGLVKNITAADWMLSKPNVGDVIVELKGRDVAHALDQVAATADFAVQSGIAQKKVAGLVLCTEHPGINTKIQIAMNKFAVRYKG